MHTEVILQKTWLRIASMRKPKFLVIGLQPTKQKKSKSTGKPLTVKCHRLCKAEFITIFKCHYFNLSEQANNKEMFLCSTACKYTPQHI